MLKVKNQIKHAGSVKQWLVQKISEVFTILTIKQFNNRFNSTFTLLNFVVIYAIDYTKKYMISTVPYATFAFLN